MIRNLIRISLILILPVLSIAQSNYRPGYIVDFKNDTTRGFIDYREWDNTPKTFNFKESLSDKDGKTLSTTDVLAVAIINVEYFLRANVEISNSYLDVSALKRRDTTFKLAIVFLKQIVNGKKVSLYAYTDDIKTRFYIQDKGNGLISELKYYKYLSEDDKYMIQTDNVFRLQLSKLAAAYNPDEKVFKQIHSAVYLQSDLQDIVRSINGETNVPVVQNDQFGIRFFAGAGLQLNGLSINGDVDVSGPGVNSYNTFPVINGGIDFILNKLTQRIFFRIDASATYNSYTSVQNLDVISVEGYSSTGSLEFKQFTFALTPQVVYNVYSKSDLKVFIDAGFSLNFSSYNNHQYTENFENNFSLVKPGYPEFENLWPSVPIKSGVTINNKFEIYLGYSFAPSISQWGFYASLTSYKLGLNYLFGM